MSWVDRIKPADVDSIRSLAEYVQQTCGVPYPTGKDIGIAGKHAKWFLENNPAATWQTLCKVADWAKAKKRRPATLAAFVAWAKYAWEDGFLPELNPTEAEDEDVEAGIAAALDVETDPEWSRRLRASMGVTARREVLEAWRARTTRIERTA